MAATNSQTALYIVVHHPDDPSRPFANHWADPRSLQAFTTPKKVALAAMEAGIIFVHRCGFGGEPPAVVCEARVQSANPIDAREYLVRLEPLQTFEVDTPFSPGRGQNSYRALAVERRERRRR